MKKFNKLVCLLAIVSAGAFGASTTFNFKCLENVGCSIGPQLLVTVADNNLGKSGVTVGSGQVMFLFENTTGISQPSITEIYFDDGSLFGISSVVGSTGVSMKNTPKVDPKDLPGGNTLTPEFDVTANFWADVEPEQTINGVNNGEWVAIVFSLINGKGYTDVISALVSPVFESNDLRIGLHVRDAYFDGKDWQSASFVNNGVVPEPGFYGALALGLSGLYLAVRRKRA